MKILNKKSFISFLGYLFVTTSSLAMNNEEGQDVRNKYLKYQPSHSNAAYVAKIDIPQDDSSSISTSTSSSDSEEGLLPALSSNFPGHLYSLPYNHILNALASWPGDLTGAVDCWMAQEGASDCSWVPGTMTIQRHQITWVPTSKSPFPSVGIGASAALSSAQPFYAPRSFGHIRKVRVKSKTEFILLGKHDGAKLKRSHKKGLIENQKGKIKGTQLGDRLRVSDSVDPWIKAINSYIAQVSNWEKLSRLGSDFISKATTFGRMIIEEYNLPDFRKAIKKSSLVGGVAGGDKFIIHDILFKFSIDPELSPNSNRWLYGGSKADDAKAFKSFNHELLGANAVARYGV